MTGPERTNLPLVLLLWAAGLGAAAQFGKISVLYDMLGDIYAGYGIGIMVSVVGVVGLIFGTTAGLLVERIGYRKVLVAALIAGSLISFFQANFPTFPLMMASRVLEGFSHLAIVVAGPVLIATVTAPRHLGAAMSFWSSFFGVSFALTTWLGLTLVDHYGPASLLLAHAAFMALLAIALYLKTPARTRVPDHQPLSLPLIINQHKQIYASPFIAAPALGFVFYTCLYVAILTLLPTLFNGTERIVVATAMPLFSTTISLTLGVWLLMHLSAFKLVQWGFGVAAISAVMLGLVWGNTIWAAGFSIMLAGALGLVQGASFASIPQLNDTQADRAYAAGALAQLGNLGTTTGTPLLAVMIATAGITGVLGFVLPLAIAGVIMIAWLDRRRRQVQ